MDVFKFWELDMFFKFFNGVKTFYNVLTPDEIETIIVESSHLLRKIDERHPGLQTLNDFHVHMRSVGKYHILEKIQKSVKADGWILNSWVNYTNPSMRYSVWHTHVRPNISLDCTCIVYLSGEEEHGTVYRKNGKIYKSKGIIGSAVTLPEDLEHSVPENIKYARFSLAIDFAKY